VTNYAWRVFPGEEHALPAVRRWLRSLLPAGPARDDVLCVATELGSNAVRHTASGRGGWFSVEVTWLESALRVAVADCGGAAEPHVHQDPDGERGRGLLLVRGLSLRTGVRGDRRGRLVWADCAYGRPSPNPGTPSSRGTLAALSRPASIP
jgi:serine/threonine-protein kinase RsbW